MYLSRLFERVRAALFGRRTHGRYSPPATPTVRPPVPATRLSPDACGARLGVARRRRRERHARPVQAPQPQPRAEWFPPDPWEHAGALVRAYVERLGDPPRQADTSAQAGPWRDAR